MSWIITLALLTVLFWVGYHIAGALLSAAVWLFIKLPFALLLVCFGLGCFVTLLLIPLEKKCFHFALRLLE